MNSATQTPMNKMFIPTAQDSDIAARELSAHAYLEPFFQAGILSNTDVMVMGQLSRMVGETAHEVLLACALAIRAPHHGHICVNLTKVQAELEIEKADEQEDETNTDTAIELAWPGAQTWHQQLAASPLVRMATDTDAKKPFVLDGTYIYTERYWNHQKELADALISRANAQTFKVHDAKLFQRCLTELFRPPPHIEYKAPTGINRQFLSVAMSALRPLTVVSGGPGMGKTWTVRNVLAMLYMQREAQRSDREPALKVGLAAPSGKAAARMRESILKDFDEFEANLRNAAQDESLADNIVHFLKETIQASTIHRLLGYQGRTPTRFKHNSDNPLPYDVVVIDESSMVDLAMMTRILNATAPETKLILLGDKHQLASVEAGTVLADICGPITEENMSMNQSAVDAIEALCGLPAANTLTIAETQPISNCIVQYNKNYRFDEESGIGTFAKRCLALEHLKPDASQAEIKKLLQNVSNTFNETFEANDLDFQKHNNEGRLSDTTKETIGNGFKEYIRMLLEDAEQYSDSVEFHEKVLKQFDTFRLLTPHRKGTMGVEGLNTEVESLLNEVVKAEKFTTKSKFYVGRPILIRENDYSQKLFNGDVGLVISPKKVAFPDAEKRVRYVTTARLPKHQTVYAMTIHSSQGSEFSHAMVVLPAKRSKVVSRELIYTGVTRGKDKMTMVGTIDLLEKALEAKPPRASGLKKILWGE